MRTEFHPIIPIDLRLGIYTELHVITHIYSHLNRITNLETVTWPCLEQNVTYNKAQFLQIKVALEITHVLLMHE